MPSRWRAGRTGYAARRHALAFSQGGSTIMQLYLPPAHYPLKCLGCCYSASRPLCCRAGAGRVPAPATVAVTCKLGRQTAPTYLGDRGKLQRSVRANFPAATYWERAKTNQ